MNEHDITIGRGHSETAGSTSSRIFIVPGISCDHCKTAIEASVGQVSGVDSVTVDIAAKSVTVTGGTESDIVAAIDDAGYDVA